MTRIKKVAGTAAAANILQLASGAMEEHGAAAGRTGRRLVSSGAANLLQAGFAMGEAITAIATLSKRLSLTAPDTDVGVWERDRSRWEQERESHWEDALELLIASHHECLTLVSLVCESNRLLEQRCAALSRSLCAHRSDKHDWSPATAGAAGIIAELSAQQLETYISRPVHRSEASPPRSDFELRSWGSDDEGKEESAVISDGLEVVSEDSSDAESLDSEEAMQLAVSNMGKPWLYEKRSLLEDVRPAQCWKGIRTQPPRLAVEVAQRQVDISDHVMFYRCISMFMCARDGRILTPTCAEIGLWREVVLHRSLRHLATLG